MKIAFIGKCMAELRDAGEGKLKQSYAGDVYNSAVYLKRTFANCEVEFLSAVGQDKISLGMLDHAKREHVSTRFMTLSEKQTIGLYQIHTDDAGERSFTYWRSASAAKQMFSAKEHGNPEQHIETLATTLQEFDMVMFSGITLAILEPESRVQFWQLLDLLKRSSVQIIFDVNYRPVLWESERRAQDVITQACRYADILLPGVEDFTALFDLHSAQDIMHFCRDFDLKELVIKNGSGSVHYVDAEGSTNEVSLTPATSVVDTTSAGDAFNGVYLGARLHSMKMVEAIKLASRCSAFVIQHKGAIVDGAAYADFCRSLHGA